ncbi:MAG: imelysin family protein [Bacteroidota bacterium]
MYSTKVIPLFLSALSVLFFLASCNSPETGLSEDELKAAASNYADIVLANYQDSYDEAAKLKELIDVFVAAPSEAGFEACREQWLKARVPYGQTEAFRFYGGPIDDEDGPEGLLNAWPMDENFIDYVEGEPDAGMINDLEQYPEINKQLLTDLNESFSEESIFTGYHAVEFLLWGQDLFADSPGRRPYTDYLEGGTAPNPERRGQYLQITADLILDHLNTLIAEWKEGGAYRNSFLALSQEEVITKIFTSLGELSKGELSGERMFVAVDSKDQENEHSCFADNTISDIEENFRGMVNVYRGQYTKVNGEVVSGVSYAALAAKINPEKAQAVDEAIKASEQAIEEIPAPFDQAILNNQKEVLAAVSALEDLSDTFADVSFELKK